MLFYQFWTIMILIVGTFLILLLETVNQRKIQPWVAMGSTLLALGSISLWMITDNSPQFFGLEGLKDSAGNTIELGYDNALLVLDKFTAFFSIIFLVITFFVIMASITDLKHHRGENRFVFYSLLLLAASGMILVSASIDLVPLVISWELVSIPSYLLVAYEKKEKDATEAAVKFFIIGAISSALMLFGASFLYGISGSTNIYVIMRDVVQVNQVTSNDFTAFIVLGVVLVVAGFGFKMGAVPFQWWLPDTYEGSLTSVTTMLAAASKKVGFAAGFRVILIPLIAYGDKFIKLNQEANEAILNLLLVIAIFTMILGNIGALAQTKMKRLLAYSSIGQAGYIVLAIASSTERSLTAGLFHVFTHAIMALAAFIAVMAIDNYLLTDDIEDYKGLRTIFPKTSYALTLTLLSLAGIPPLIGFISKFFIFFAAIEAGNTLPLGSIYYLAAVIAILTSAISVYYYIRVVKYMLWDPPNEDMLQDITEKPPTIEWNLSIPIAFSTIIILGGFLLFFLLPFYEYLADISATSVRAVEPIINYFTFLFN